MNHAVRIETNLWKEIKKRRPRWRVFEGVLQDLEFIELRS